MDWCFCNSGRAMSEKLKFGEFNVTIIFKFYLPRGEPYLITSVYVVSDDGNKSLHETRLKGEDSIISRFEV